MKIIRIILVIATLMSCTTEKDIIWDEFEVNGLSGYPNMEYRDMIFINDRLGYMMGNSDNLLHGNTIETIVYTTADGGHNWEIKEKYQGEGVCFKRNGETFMLLQTIHLEDDTEAKHSIIYISQDNGTTWNRKLELSFKLYNVEMITNDYWIGSCRNHVYYTKDAGATWEQHRLSMPKTDNRLAVITHDGNVVYMSNNQIVSEHIETKERKVLMEFPAKEQHYCDGYAYNAEKGNFLIISDSNFTNCQLYSFSNNTIHIPSNAQIGITSMSVSDNHILINGYDVYADGLSKCVFFYSDNNGSHWVRKDLEIEDLASPVTFCNDEIIAYCFKKNRMIRTSLKKEA